MIYRLSSKKIYGILIALGAMNVSALMPCHAGNKAGDIEAVIAQGDEAYVNNDLNKAVSLYGKAYRMLPSSNANAELKSLVEERYQKAQTTSTGMMFVSTTGGVEQKAVARKMDNVQEAMVHVDAARRLYSEQKFEEAVKEYRAALEIMPDAPVVADRRRFIQESLADANVVVAQQYMKVGRYDEAEALLQEALKIAPNHRLAKRTMGFMNDPVRNNPAMTPKHAADVAEVSRLLNLGYGYYDLGKYDDAIKAFESVLKIDKTNEAARRGMESVEKRKAKYYRTAYAETRARALTEVDSKWEQVAPGLDDADAQVFQQGDEMAVKGQQAIENKLRSIIIPNIDFDEIDILDAINYLRRQTEVLDRGETAAERGVNIVLNLGDPGSETAQKIMSKKFNLKMQGVPLADVIQYIAQMTGTVAYTTAYTVEFSTTTSNMPFVGKSIQVPPGFFSDMAASAQEEPLNPFAEPASGSGMSIKRTNPKEALQKMGISFPDGATMQYNSATSSLYMYNSPDNIRLLEDLVAVRSTEQPVQVIVNATIIEVSEDTLNELGFDWIVNLNFDVNKWYGSGGGNVADSGSLLPDIPGMSMPRAGVMTQGLRSSAQIRYTDNIDNVIQNGLSGYRSSGTMPGTSSGFFSIYGAWSQAQVGMVMRGLDQKKSVDILQKPQVIVRLGEKAQFYSGREFSYPENYEPPEIPSSGSTRNGSPMVVTPAHPSDFATRETGTSFEVEVTGINEAKTNMDLAINLESVEFDGFINYGSPITQPMVGIQNNVASSLLGGGDYITNVEISKNEILKPVFTTRQANTSVSIQTGSTVVFGAMKKSRFMTYEDKVPIVGDIPLLGRLFRSSGKQEQKQMVLMFVKAEIVDASGKQLHTARESVLSESLNDGLLNFSSPEEDSVPELLTTSDSE